MWQIAGATLKSRLFLGTSRYPSLDILTRAIQTSACQAVTVALRRYDPNHQGNFGQTLKDLNVAFLPNTAGCQTVKEAVTTAHLARELFGTSWIKLELVGDEQTLEPHPFLLIQATEKLLADGFTVFPYTNDNLVVAKELYNAGCRILMPGGSPIGTGQGITHPRALQLLRDRFGDVQLIVDAGLGAPSHAAFAMELGCDGVLVNTAVARAADPVAMAQAFAKAVEAGRQGFEAGLVPKIDQASASTPQWGKATF
jgi:thiazole synthase